MPKIVTCEVCGEQVYSMQTRKQPSGRHRCTTCLKITPGDNSPKTTGKSFTKRKSGGYVK